jgi:hypothetical protein
MSSKPAVGDKRSALDAPDASDDDDCAEQGAGTAAAGPKPEQGEMRNKKLRRHGGARNLPRPEERKTAIVRQIEEMEYEERTPKAGTWSTGLEGRVRHGNEKVGVKRRFQEICGTGGGEAAEERPCLVREGLLPRWRANRRRGRRRIAMARPRKLARSISSSISSISRSSSEDITSISICCREAGLERRQTLR